MSASAFEVLYFFINLREARGVFQALRVVAIVAVAVGGGQVQPVGAGGRCRARGRAGAPERDPALARLQPPGGHHQHLGGPAPDAVAGLHEPRRPVATQHCASGAKHRTPLEMLTQPFFIIYQHTCNIMSGHVPFRRKDNTAYPPPSPRCVVRSIVFTVFAVTPTALPSPFR